MMLASLKRLVPEQHPLRLLWHKSKGFAAALCAGFPAKKLCVIGITGTDGKTTTVSMVTHILKHNGIKTGSLSTACFEINGKTTWNATQKTSPSPFTVQRFLRKLIEEGCTHAVLEYSSHGLIQGRTLCTFPRVAAITNTTPEHLDYHGTMEEYRRAKSILFSMVGKRGTKVLNRDDGTYETYGKIATMETYTYGWNTPQSAEQGHHLVLQNEECTTTDIAADIALDGETLRLSLSLAGRFNLLNAACAICVAAALGISPRKAVTALGSFRSVPGRMEHIDEGQDFAVFVDFTVTPASYTATLTTLRQSLKPGGRLLVLMGSCGNRMREKRPVIGKIASELADIVVVTNEDPYTENPSRIIDEVWSGINQATTEAHKIADRLKGIDFILKQARKNDTVVLCGKGSDTTMWVSTGQIPWNEREIVRSMLKSMRRT